jgi:site-specific recombinase XerD
MTIYKQPGSPYYYYDFYFEKRRYQASTHLRNKTFAHRVECIKKAELAQRRAGILPKKQIPLFRDFAERFLHTVKVERRRNTHRAYLSCVRNLEPVFGRKYLDEITPEMIRAFKEARIEKRRSPATVNRDLSCLRQIVGIAVKEELIQKSPFFGGRVEFLHEKGRERTLSFDEERKYLKVATPLLRDVGIIMVEMGLRPGEIFQLRHEDVRIELPAPYAHVREGKSDTAVRDVPITSRALPVLNRRISKAKGEYLFPRRIGNGYDWSRPMTELEPAHQRALRKSGIEPPFRLYDLRHTYGTRAIEAGIDVFSVAKLMGHADLSTTQRYVHLSKGHLEDAQKRIERFRARQRSL